MKRYTGSRTKIRDLRHTLIKISDVMRGASAYLSLAMRRDPLPLIRGFSEFETIIYGPAVTFAFPDAKVESYRRSVLHLNFISAVEGSILNWCEQNVLCELMSEDLMLAKIAEPDMTAVILNDHFRDRQGISKCSQNS